MPSFQPRLPSWALQRSERGPRSTRRTRRRKKPTEAGTVSWFPPVRSAGQRLCFPRILPRLLGSSAIIPASGGPMTRMLAVLLLLVSFPATSGAAKVTVDDLMNLRSIVDVRISPDGDRVAYVVSTPSLERNAHEAAIYVVEARGGAARRLAEKARVFGTNLPAPKLRWSPDGASVSFLGVAGERPQVFAVAVAGAAPGGEARALTNAPE
ncbi:MAG TPA: LpqB family beta-propeller domain-containing protein, partial [Thermoanaerobaculia bacterium]|nr:LpqB family beta-propeller domain-containing protein [Thermoanaerobaculia bacterium]